MDSLDDDGDGVVRERELKVEAEGIDDLDQCGAEQIVQPGRE